MVCASWRVFWGRNSRPDLRARPSGRRGPPSRSPSRRARLAAVNGAQSTRVFAEFLGLSGRNLDVGELLEFCRCLPATPQMDEACVVIHGEQFSLSRLKHLQSLITCTPQASRFRLTSRRSAMRGIEAEAMRRLRCGDRGYESGCRSGALCLLLLPVGFNSRSNERLDISATIPIAIAQPEDAFNRTSFAKSREFRFSNWQ